MRIPCRLNHPYKILLIGCLDFQTVPQHIFTVSAAKRFQPDVILAVCRSDCNVFAEPDLVVRIAEPLQKLIEIF